MKICMEYAELLVPEMVCEKYVFGTFFENLFRFLQDIWPNASIKMMKTWCMVFTFQ